MNFNEFLHNVKKFHPYEVEASKRIEKLNNTITISFNDTYKYDFITSDNSKYEVKTEPMSLKTKNYFIEYLGYGKASGITLSEAHFYIFCDTINYYMIDIEKLKQIVEKYGVSRKNNCNNALGFLVKCDIINSNSVII